MEYLKVNDELSNDDDLVLDGYLAVFGGTDLVGEHFVPDTKFESSYTAKNLVAIDWEHGLEPDDVKNQPGGVIWVGVAIGTLSSDDTRYSTFPAELQIDYMKSVPVLLPLWNSWNHHFANLMGLVDSSGSTESGTQAHDRLEAVRTHRQGSTHVLDCLIALAKS